MWEIRYAKMAVEDAQKIAQCGLKEKTLSLIAILQNNPFQNPPLYEKLLGDLSVACSRRINIQHRLVYEVFENLKTVRILRMWSHYE